MKERKSTLVFVHIPKTAGTTLIHVLKDKYKNVFQTNGLVPKLTKDEFEGFSAKKKNEFDGIIGHLTLGLAEYVENPILLTYLRNPVDHFMSVFHYIRRAKSNRLHSDVKKIEDINDFISYAKEVGEDNLQTRHLAGATEHLTNPDISPHDMSIDGDDLLEKAKENLRKIKYVFHTNQFDESLMILHKDLKWNTLPFYTVKNKTKNRPKVASVDPELKEKIIELNQYDMALFEFSKDLNRDLMAKYSMENKVRRFQRLNNYRQNLTDLKASLIKYGKHAFKMQ